MTVLIKNKYGYVEYAEEQEVKEETIERILDSKEPIYVYDYAAGDFVPVMQAKDYGKTGGR